MGDEPQPAPPAGDAPRTFSQAEVDQIVARQRREFQEKLDAAGERARALEAQVSELRPVAQRASELEKRVGELEPVVGKTRVENALITEAVKAGAKRPDHIVRLVDSSSVRLEDGEVKGAAEAIAALAQDSPNYFQAGPQPSPPTDGGARSRSAPPPAPAPNDEINAAIRGAAGFPAR